MYLLPKPREMKMQEGSFVADHNMRIVMDTKINGSESVPASVIHKCIKKWGGLSLAIIKGVPQTGDIYLTLTPEYGKQEYHLTIGEEGIIIKGGDCAGVMYGAQTLCQMIEQCGCVLPCLEISDSPAFMHRGYYLDQTRGRVLKLEKLKKIVDLLARYKINEFQLYIEHTYLFHGSSEMWRDETPLTAQEIMELDSYCQERYIELIPSLSSFGHLYNLLSTKSYSDLCELPDSEKQPFSYLDRMLHHTINVSDDRALSLVKGRILEYMALFSSDKFNICADETFDLGKGRAKSLADGKGVHRIYIDFVKSLCEFLVENGKTPMFWGDIICAEPELIRELPEETICLTWGYAPDQSEDDCRKMAQAGAMQYCCPGVSGWNQWMNQLESSYLNITRMCSYAEKYGALGILNTDWGDFGHINHPDHSIPGMIYGAAFSWSREEIPFEEINKQISVVEFQDRSGQIVNLLAGIPGNCLFNWESAIAFYETMELQETRFNIQEGAKQLADENIIKTANDTLVRIGRQLKENVINMDSSMRWRISSYLLIIEGIQIFNEMGPTILKQKQSFELAARLETWYMSYKELWRSTSKEGDLHHLSEIIFWYADLLRGQKRSKTKISPAD